MADPKSKDKKSIGYHQGDVNTVISVDDVNRQAQELGSGVSLDQIAGMIKGEPFLKIENLRLIGINGYHIDKCKLAINHFNKILKIYNLPRGKLNRVKEWIERCQQNFQVNQS